MCRIMAQGTISGKVVDENKHPLPYVSVVLQHVQDSSYVNGVTTDAEGIILTASRITVQVIRMVTTHLMYLKMNLHWICINFRLM